MSESAWASVFVAGEFRFAWPASWTWTSSVEVALDSFTVSSRCPLGTGNSCDFDVFTCIIVLLLLLCLGSLPFCICKFCCRKKPQQHVHQTMPTEVQAWVLGAETLRAHPSLNDALKDQAEREKEEAAKARADEALRRRKVGYLDLPAQSSAFMTPQKLANEGGVTASRHVWRIELVGHASGSASANDGDFLDEPGVRVFLVAAAASSLPAADSSLSATDPRERRRCACAPGGDALEWLVGLGALLRESELLRSGAARNSAEARQKRRYTITPIS